jgi:phosphopantetheine adenylyltransferase
MDQMKDYRQLIKELPSKTVVFAFGRFNPPTIGHELLVKAVKKLAQQKNADHVIYASRSQDSKKNPLTVDKKVKYLNLMFRNTKFAAANEHVRTFIEAAKELNKRYKNIVMVAGSDRVPEFKRLLNTYNGKEFNFDTIEVISAGERDPDADDASGMSASKMRALAVKGNYSEFKKGLPSTVRDIDGKRLMNDIREGMGLESIKEQIVLVKDDLREKYFRGEIFNEGDIVESDGEKFTIVKRGSNHLLLKEQTGALVSKWIHDVQPTEEKDMNEALTDKTLKPNDKLKVARIIATMLGVENAETSSNPDMLINQALRRVRTKSLNPEALAILDKMLNLATEQGIQYDATLKPTKLKEAVTQPNGTDKISVTTDSPVVNKKSKYNFAKDVLRFNDFKKLQKVQEQEQDYEYAAHSMADNKKDNESDHDYEHAVKVTDPTEVGHTLVHPGGQDNLRRRKVKYHLGEEQIDEVSSDLVKKARDVAFAKGKDDQGHRFVKKAYEKGQKESDTMAKKLSEELDESTSAGLAAKAQKSGVSLSTLKKVYARGVAAWNSGHRPGTTPQQWGMARVNSYITKGKGTYHGADKDLREEEELEEAKLPEVPKDKESGLPKKYVAGLSSATAKARAAHWDKMDKKSDSDPSAYEPAPGDATAKTKESKHTKKYRAMFGEDMEEEIYEACWVGYKQVGIKKKGNKYVPNCVKESAVDVSEYEENWEEHIFADEDPSEEEIEHFMNHISDDDIYDLYDEEELTVVDDETGEELPEDEEEKQLEEETLMEVLSRVERMKAKFRIRRTKAKRERATKIALKRYSNTNTINKRSRRLAIKLMKKRLLRGRDPSKISVAEKERVEKVIQNRKQIINRLAMRLAPRVRKIEKSRLSHTKMTKGSSNVAF